jgi:hypothetical protein
MLLNICPLHYIFIQLLITLTQITYWRLGFGTSSQVTFSKYQRFWNSSCWSYGKISAWYPCQPPPCGKRRPSASVTRLLASEEGWWWAHIFTLFCFVLSGKGKCEVYGYNAVFRGHMFQNTDFKVAARGRIEYIYIYGDKVRAREEIMGSTVIGARSCRGKV